MKSENIFSILDNYPESLRFQKGMTRVGRRLIEDFLLPALNEERYGELLCWINRDKQIFSIRWSHKNAAKWTLDDTLVFQDWDKMKGHYHPEIKGYYMQSKQRFRAALYKLSTVRKLRTDDKHMKLYQLVLDNEKTKNFDCTVKARIKKELNEQQSRPSVICKNINYIKKEPSEDDSQQIFTNPYISSDSPVSFTDSVPYNENSSNSNEKLSQTSDSMLHNPNLHSELNRNHSNLIALVKARNKLNSEYNYLSCSSKRNMNHENYRQNKHDTNKWDPENEKHLIKPLIQDSSYDSLICEVPVGNKLVHTQFIKPVALHILPNNRHVPVCPIPVYSKTPVQILSNRKVDMPVKTDLPVDLSIKRNQSHFEHSHIPVSAR